MPAPDNAEMSSGREIHIPVRELESSVDVTRPFTAMLMLAHNLLLQLSGKTSNRRISL